MHTYPRSRAAAVCVCVCVCVCACETLATMGMHWWTCVSVVCGVGKLPETRWASAQQEDPLSHAALRSDCRGSCCARAPSVQHSFENQIRVRPSEASPSWRCPPAQPTPTQFATHPAPVVHLAQRRPGLVRFDPNGPQLLPDPVTEGSAGAVQRSGTEGRGGRCTRQRGTRTYRRSRSLWRALHPSTGRAAARWRDQTGGTRDREIGGDHQPTRIGDGHMEADKSRGQVTWTGHVDRSRGHATWTH